MTTPKPKPRKVKVTLSITKEAADVLHFAGYCSDRTTGEFISRLIVEHHERVQQAKRAGRRPPAQASP